MEHRKKGRKLKRTASHRKALLSNLANSLILHKRIKTTEAKAKELRTYIEPLITKAKTAFLNPEKSVHQRRITASLLKNREAVKVLFDEIGEMVKDRPGGYTRVLKMGFRPGDGASEAIIELVDYDVAKIKSVKAESKESKKKTEGKGKTTEDTTDESIAKEEKKKPASSKEKVSKAPKKEKAVKKDKSEAKPKTAKPKAEKSEKAKAPKKSPGKKKD
jgi:large subunit ribosomal protein L17